MKSASQFHDDAATGVCAPAAAPPSYERADRNSWFTQGQKAKCPHCHGIYVLKRNGEMRTHTCVPFMVMDAADLLPSLG